MKWTQSVRIISTFLRSSRDLSNADVPGRAVVARPHEDQADDAGGAH
jgi:hypothetical protein